MDAPSRSFYAKLAERVLWTAVQAGLGAAAVYVADLPLAYAPLIASALSVVKGYIARRFGDPNDPSTLPAGV